MMTVQCKRNVTSVDHRVVFNALTATVKVDGFWWQRPNLRIARKAP